MYFPAEGIYGVTLWIVSTVVFHFVLFGVLAQRMGLGQFFVDIATVAAGRYTGGLAKVSVVSSAFFGTIPEAYCHAKLGYVDSYIMRGFNLQVQFPD